MRKHENAQTGTMTRRQDETRRGAKRKAKKQIKAKLPWTLDVRLLLPVIAPRLGLLSLTAWG